jgi:hypothetical protein
MRQGTKLAEELPRLSLLGDRVNKLLWMRRVSSTGIILW